MTSSSPPSADLTALDQRLFEASGWPGCPRAVLRHLAAARSHLAPLLPGHLPTDEDCAAALAPPDLPTALRLAQHGLRAARDHAPLLQIMPLSFAVRFVGFACHELLYPVTADA